MYSWNRFGREAEYVVALYLKSLGWEVSLSRGSRGPADIVASIEDVKWFIQVKSSGAVPRLKGYEVKRLIDMAGEKGGLAVVSTLQPSGQGFSIGNFSISFYLLDSWQPVDPSESGCSAWQPGARSHGQGT